MKKILFLTLIAFAVLFTASCEKRGTLYEIPDGAVLVSFTSDVAIFSMLSEDGNKITVSLNRGNTKGAASVPFTFTDGTDGVFTPAKTTFDFADGEAVATVDITYPDINAFGGEIYEMVLTVAEEQLSPSGIGELSIQAQRKLTPKLLGTGTYYSDWYEESWEQEVYNTVEAPDYYILPSCWVKGTNFTFSVIDGKIVFPDDFYSGYDYGQYGPVNMAPSKVEYDNGKVTVSVSYYLPEYYNYLLGTGVEEFTFPEGIKPL